MELASSDPCDQETYLLQASMDNVHWVDLQELPRFYITYDMLKPYSKFKLFRTVSTVTHQVLQKAHNTAVKGK